MIPQYEPVIDRETLAKELHDYTAYGNGFFTEFKLTAEFEKQIGLLVGAKHVFAVNNGSISLSLALLAMGVKAGDCVLVPNITMIATSNAVKLIGARPVFVDLDERTLCMDLNRAKREIQNDYIKAVIYVTLNGRAHRSEELASFHRMCRNYGVAIIEDNAQSLGSCHSDRTPISCPPNGIGSFSFSMPKIITTGQGGCLVTNDSEIADKIKRLKDFGRSRGGIDTHDYFGINAKFTEPQAIMGLNQLKDIAWRISTKKSIYNAYQHLLGSMHEIMFLPMNTDYTCPWFADVFVLQRDELVKHLAKRNIGSRPIYPELTSQKTNHRWFQPKSLRKSKYYAEHGLWLPSSLNLNWANLNQIAEAIKEFYGK